MMNKGIRLESKTWQQEDKMFVADRLLDVGIQSAEEIMELRVFDLLNLNRIDAGAAEEAIMVLYRLYNPNTSADVGMEDGTIDQNYSFKAWRRNHRDLSKVTVGELVMSENINGRAIARLFNRILKAFYKSNEYNSREYRFLCYEDLLQQKEKEAAQ